MSVEGTAGAVAPGAMSTMNNETFDLSVKLRQRLAETNARRERIQGAINVQNEQLQRMLSKIPKKPRDSAETMERKLVDLEYERTRASLSLSKEKAILRQIQMVKRSKIQLDEYKVHEAAIQEKKGELSILRDSLRTEIAAIAELDSALSKVELARRLNCSTNDLKTRVVHCPAGKLGHVIGKSGSNLKQLEAKTGVQIDVDKVGSKIHLHGSDAALDMAVVEVENITLSIEEVVKLPKTTSLYLSAKRSAVLNKIQENNPNVYMDLTRVTSKLQIRGRPENVQAAKDQVLNLQIKVLSRTLVGRETGLVVGKGGATITKLVDDHDVVLDVSKDDSSADNDSSLLQIIGLSPHVEAAFDEVDNLLYENEEIEFFFIVKPMMRNKFLSNAGAVMKEVQSEILTQCGGGILFYFEKITKEQMKETSKLFLKAPRMTSDKAKNIIQSHIDSFEASLVAKTIPIEMIPSIIGKGGSTINSLRQKGSGADIEVDKLTGVIHIQSDDDETKQSIVEAIDAIIAENQVLKVDVERHMLSVLFGETGKDIRKQVVEDIGVVMAVHPSDRHVVLRGTEEKITEAAECLRDFIKNNHTGEIQISSDDESLAFHGGGFGSSGTSSDSILKQVENEYGVKTNLRKATHVITLRGTEESVASALKVLKRFFFGSVEDNFAVSKVKIPEDLLGVIIGKGGSNISKLENDYGGVTLHLHRDTNNLSIRGPTDNVDKCRAKVITLILTAKVNETFFISTDDYISLNRPEVFKKLTFGVAVQTNLMENSLKLRGTSVDVRYVKGLVYEHLTGHYETYIELDDSQLEKVRTAIRDPSHFDRIQSSTNATVSLNTVTSSIVISGKRSSVKKAKTYLMGFLDFLLPSEFGRVKVAKPLILSMTDSTGLGKIAAETNVMVVPDRDLGYVVARSSNVESVQRAVELLNMRLKECEKFIFVTRFEHSDSWLLPKVTGPGGVTLQKIQTDSGCKVEVFKDELTVAISGDKEEKVNIAKSIFNEIIERARKENVYFDFPDSAMPAFIGKQGANIKKLAQTHNVTIERMRKDPYRINIRGNEVAVQNTILEISAWLNEWESKNIGLTLNVEEKLIPLIQGRNGTVVSSIQKEFGCKVDFDRKNFIVTVRGNNDSRRRDAMAKINDIVTKHKAMIAAEQEEEERKKKEIEMELQREKDKEKQLEIEKQMEALKKVEMQKQLEIQKQKETEQEMERQKQKEIEQQMEMQNRMERQMQLQMKQLPKSKPTSTELNGTASRNGPSHKSYSQSQAVSVEKNGHANSYSNNNPVGLTVVESNPSATSKIEKDKALIHEPKVPEPSQSAHAGSNAARNLLNMLVSDDMVALPDKGLSPTKVLSSSAPEEQWDSSTVSSAAISAADNDDENGGETSTAAKSYYKSSSGFNVRV